MKNEKMTPTTLASYALLKALTDSNEYKNQYELLSEFIKYIITKKKLRGFMLIDIQNMLDEEFSFSLIPQAAIKTAIKQIKECKKEGDNYYIESSLLDTKWFSDLQSETTQKQQGIVDDLFEYAKSVDQTTKKDILEESFIKYLVDDTLSINSSYSEIISKFLILNEADKDFQKQVSEIREGSVLYCGLAYNMTEVGSLNNDLTLFLDTEVLFNIAGFNGTIYQKIAEDLLNQVKLANKKQKRIKLRYFQEVQNEIDNFFRSAELTVLGKGEFIQNTAMRSITNGCVSISDVRNKQADFYNDLRIKYEILKDEKEDYYTEEDYKYNIESIPEGFEQDEKSFEAIKFISHINKLRKGNCNEDIINCKYLLVTETRRIQEIAEALKERQYSCTYAMPTSAITNVLWFKLGCSFSKMEYPANVDASYKARGILSGILSYNVNLEYNKIKKEYNNGDLTKDQVANRIVILRDKTTSPDGITADNIDDLLDFSPEAIDKFEQGIKANKIQIDEQKQIIKQLEEEKEAVDDERFRLIEENSRITTEMKEKDDAIRNKEEHIQVQEKTIQEQGAELERLREEKRKYDEYIIKRNRILKLIGGCIVSAIIFFVMVIIISKISNKIRPETSKSIEVIIDSCGIIGFLISVFSMIKKYIYNEHKKNDDKKN